MNITGDTEDQRTVVDEWLKENPEHKVPDVQIFLPKYEEFKEVDPHSDSDCDSEEAAKEYYSLKNKLP